MPRQPMPDLIVLLPGITGSVLTKKGKVAWGFSGSTLARSLVTRGGHMKRALFLKEDPADEDDLEDGVVAEKLIPDLHLLPGLWKIDGYTQVANAIKSRFDVEEGKNFFPFPYDWRRDNRVAARKLRVQTQEWLRRWRQSSGNAEAKLILVAHSMGGIVSRYFLEVLEGWRDTRALVTFGTPYRGSLNALNTLANGVRKGPFGLLDLSDLSRSFTSIYQLLPIYTCYDGGTGALVRVAEAGEIPNVDVVRAKAALAFHREIEMAVDANRKLDAYRTHGYRVYPIVGIAQETSQSAVLKGKKVEMRSDYEGTDHRGDGTVPRVSATPIEYSGEGREMFAATRHGSLQNADAVLTHLDGLINSLYFDLGGFRKPHLSPVKVNLEVEDLYWSSEPIVVRARPDRDDVQLIVRITNTETGTPAGVKQLKPDPDGWHVASLEAPGEGAYEIIVSGGPDVEPVTDAFAVAGVDLEDVEE